MSTTDEQVELGKALTWMYRARVALNATHQLTMPPGYQRALEALGRARDRLDPRGNPEMTDSLRAVYVDSVRMWLELYDVWAEEGCDHSVGLCQCRVDALLERVYTRLTGIELYDTDGLPVVSIDRAKVEALL